MKKALQPALAPLALVALASCHSTFDLIDSDRSSRVSSDEFAAHVQRSAFDQIDTDRNGVLDPAEWKAVETVNEPQARFRRLDKDHDRQLSYEEFAGDPRKGRVLKRIFSTLDRDGDDHLVPRELHGSGNQPH